MAPLQLDCPQTKPPTSTTVCPAAEEATMAPLHLADLQASMAPLQLDCSQKIQLTPECIVALASITRLFRHDDSYYNWLMKCSGFETKLDLVQTKCGNLPRTDTRLPTAENIRRVLSRHGTPSAIARNLTEEQIGTYRDWIAYANMSSDLLQVAKECLELGMMNLSKAHIMDIMFTSNLIRLGDMVATPIGPQQVYESTITNKSLGTWDYMRCVMRAHFWMGLSGINYDVEHQAIFRDLVVKRIDTTLKLLELLVWSAEAPFTFHAYDDKEDIVLRTRFRPVRKDPGESQTVVAEHMGTAAIDSVPMSRIDGQADGLQAKSIGQTNEASAAASKPEPITTGTTDTTLGSLPPSDELPNSANQKVAPNESQTIRQCGKYVAWFVVENHSVSPHCSSAALPETMPKILATTEQQKLLPRKHRVGVHFAPDVAMEAEADPPSAPPNLESPLDEVVAELNTKGSEDDPKLFSHVTPSPLSHDKQTPSSPMHAANLDVAFSKIQDPSSCCEENSGEVLDAKLPAIGGPITGKAGVGKGSPHGGSLSKEQKSEVENAGGLKRKSSASDTKARPIENFEQNPVLKAAWRSTPWGALGRSLSKKESPFYDPSVPRRKRKVVRTAAGESICLTMALHGKCFQLCTLSHEELSADDELKVASAGGFAPDYLAKLESYRNREA